MSLDGNTGLASAGAGGWDRSHPALRPHSKAPRLVGFRGVAQPSEEPAGQTRNAQGRRPSPSATTERRRR